MIHPECYDSCILIFFPDFTAVSLDKALKDRANRMLVSKMALLVKKRGHLYNSDDGGAAPSFIYLDVPTLWNNVVNNSVLYDFCRAT